MYMDERVPVLSCQSPAPSNPVHHQLVNQSINNDEHRDRACHLSAFAPISV